MSKSNHISERLKTIEECQTTEELMANLFSYEFRIFESTPEEQRAGRPWKHKLVAEWIDHYTVGTKCPGFTHTSPKELAEDIYKPWWKDEDGLFQGIRETLIKWIEEKKTFNPNNLHIHAHN